MRQVLDSARSAALATAPGFGERGGEQDDYEWRFVSWHLPNRNNNWDRQRVILPGVWEIAAGHLDILSSALPPLGSDVHDAAGAPKLIADFPTLPRGLVQPLLFCAVDSRLRLRKPSQSMSRDIATDQTAKRSVTRSSAMPN